MPAKYKFKSSYNSTMSGAILEYLLSMRVAKAKLVCSQENKRRFMTLTATNTGFPPTVKNAICF